MNTLEKLIFGDETAKDNAMNFLFGRYANDEKLTVSIDTGAVNIVFKLPHATHKYLIEGISSSLHPKVMMSSRFINYIKQCMHSSKQAVCFLAHLTHADMRTHVGRNILGISRDCCTNFEDLTSQKVKSSMRYAPVPEDEEWRMYVDL